MEYIDLDDMNGLADGVDQPLFGLGFVLASPNAMDAIPPEDMKRALARHASGDWGELDREDWESNEAALEVGMKLVSIYPTAAHPGWFLVITDDDRSLTTVLLPGDR
jgi:hypothetical protein